jgi:predicted ATP-grasp superfamily ATP-dependent carboligase
MFDKKNVLVFPCGSEIGLEIHRSLLNSIHFNVFGASSVDDHGKFVYKNYISDLPFIESKNFIGEVNKIIEKFKIDFIFPAHDSVVLKLAQNIHKIKAKIITAPIETCEICRSKKKTYEKFKNMIDVPKIYNSLDENIEYPVFIKPNIGQGSKGTYMISYKKDIEYYISTGNDLLISEYLPGVEYTVDCFTNRAGKLLFAKGRERKRIYSGISVSSTPVYDEMFEEIANKINSVLKFQGVWFFQLKRRSNGELVLLEIASRIAGTMSLYRGLGVNFALLSLYDAMEIEVDIIANDFDLIVDRALITRFYHNIVYEAIYIDLDDTLINDTGVNEELIKLLYFAKNNNKEIILISKHEGDISRTLLDNCISEQLFDEIIHIKKDEEKTKYMTNKKAVFIDDSFSERLKVQKKLNIPVFGLDATEILYDWRK